MRSELLDVIASSIRDATHRPFDIVRATPVSGGSINQSYRLGSRDGLSYFVKLNDAQHLAMFTAEPDGLAAITTTHTLRAPRPIIHGIAGHQSFLVLEHLTLTSRGDAKTLGTQLAAMHRHTAPQFGFAQDNFICTTPQPNTWADDWIIFWREQRLGFQLELAAQNGYGGEIRELGERLLDELTDGSPMIFDPATYYGDRECDIAMTKLFDGYPTTFYNAYQSAWPLDAGYENRRDLYNLYHILNHANLFGGGHVRQAEGIMKRLLVANK